MDSKRIYTKKNFSKKRFDEFCPSFQYKTKKRITKQDLSKEIEK